MAYNAIGNITSKSDVGAYIYPSVGAARPHALTSIAGTVNGVVNPSYSYDANGNHTGGGGRTVSYTAFNMVDTITSGSTSVAISYDSEHARIRQVLTVGSSVATTTYLNDPSTGAMSEKQVSGGTTVWRDYILVEGKMIAVKFSGGVAAVRYFTMDHLGSVSVVTDENGAVIERDAYDAWGKRREVATGSRPHALASVTGTVNGTVNPSYSYDANGNMTSGAGRDHFQSVSLCQIRNRAVFII